MPVATSVLLAGAALAIGVGTAGASAVAASQQAAATKKSAKEQKRALEAASQRKPSERTGADIKLISQDDNRRRGKGSLAQRQRAAALGGLGGQSAASIGGL